MLLFYVNYDIIFCDNKLFRFQTQLKMEDEKMIKLLDGMEIIGRAFKVPNEGLTFTKLSSRFVVYPIQTSRRIYNKSEIGDFYIFAAEFGTYIIPFVFGLEELLKKFHFKESSAAELPVSISPEYMPVGTKNQSMWYHMTNTINKYNATTACELLKLSKGDYLGFPSFLNESTKIPFSGIYDSKKGKMFYPMCSIRFPHCHAEKLGKYNIDPETNMIIIYAGDGNTYLLTADSSKIEDIKSAGYSLDPNLYVPK